MSEIAVSYGTTNGFLAVTDSDDGRDFDAVCDVDWPNKATWYSCKRSGATMIASLSATQVVLLLAPGSTAVVLPSAQYMLQ